MSEKPPTKKKSSKKTKEKKVSRSSSPTSERGKSPRSPKITSSRLDSPKRTEPELPTEPAPLNLCKLHNKELKFFSEVREELVCEDCPDMGGRSTVTLEEAHRYRMAIAYEALNCHLFQKQKLLQSQASKLKQRMEQVKNFKAILEQDMKREFVAMNERLNSSYGSKMAILNHDLSEIQGDLDRIKNIVGLVENSNQNVLGFLQKAGDLRYALDVSISKPFRTQIDVDAESLPQELAKVREITTKYDGLVSLLTVKDEIIWTLTNEKSSKVNETIQSELSEWVKLTDKFSQELEKFKLNCEICHVVLSESTINSACDRGQKHHFSKHETVEKIEEPVQDSYRSQVNEVETIRQINQTCRERGIYLDNVFKTYDDTNAGFITPTEFYQVLSNQFGLSGSQINYLAKKYDPNTSGRIKYALLLKDLLNEGSPVHAKIHRTASVIHEACKKLDAYSEGTIRQENFKDILKNNGFSPDEIKQALSLTELDSKGQVQYSTFYNRFK